MGKTSDEIDVRKDSMEVLTIIQWSFLPSMGGENPWGNCNRYIVVWLSLWGPYLARRAFTREGKAEKGGWDFRRSVGERDSWIAANEDLRAKGEMAICNNSTI